MLIRNIHGRTVINLPGESINQTLKIAARRGIELHNLVIDKTNIGRVKELDLSCVQGNVWLRDLNLRKVVFGHKVLHVTVQGCNINRFIGKRGQYGAVFIQHGSRIKRLSLPGTAVVELHVGDGCIVEQMQCAGMEGEVTIAAEMIVDIDLSGSHLSRLDIGQACIQRLSFSRAYINEIQSVPGFHIHRVVAAQASVGQADLCGGRIDAGTFARAVLQKTDFSKTILGCSFANANLPAAKFVAAKPVALTIFDQAEMDGVDTDRMLVGPPPVERVDALPDY